MRLTFPTKFAKEQNTYFVRNNTRIALFDNNIQFIYKLSFKLGAINNDGVDEYVFSSYTGEEKKFFITTSEIVFSRRDYVDAEGNNVNQIVTNKYIEKFNEHVSGYTFLNDQIVYDPQMQDNAFRNKATINVTGPSGRGFKSYADQLTIANNVMKEKVWMRKYAQKHFMIIFKSNELNTPTDSTPGPRIYYGVPIKDLREHPYDRTKY